jgi:cell wall-associated NlpC family hydrolase
MQQRILTQACARVVAGLFCGALMAATPGAFADEVTPRITDTSYSATSNAPDSAPLSIQADTTASAQDATPSVQVTTASGDNTSTLSTSGTLSTSRASRARASGKAGNVVTGALNMIGVRYRWGGNTPESGLDCSGFVRYVFQDTLGLTLPRRAVDMSHVGEKIHVSDLQPGDLVFFNTVRHAVSHVGIYIGDNKFVQLNEQPTRRARWAGRVRIAARRFRLLEAAQARMA